MISTYQYHAYLYAAATAYTDSGMARIHPDGEGTPTPLPAALRGCGHLLNGDLTRLGSVMDKVLFEQGKAS